MAVYDIKHTILDMVLMMKIGLVVYPGCMVSGLFAFAELLEAANKRAGSKYFETLWVSTDLQDVAVTIASKEMEVNISPVTTICDCSLDAILLPGFWTSGVRQVDFILNGYEQLKLALKALPSKTGIWSYCTSVCLLAASGRLNRQSATSTWWLADYLQINYPMVEWNFTQACIYKAKDATASGVNGYLPIAQKLIAKYCGQDVLRDIIDLMVLAKPNSNNQAFQFISLMQLDDKLMQKIYVWAEATPAKELTINLLAKALNTTERTVSRKVKAATNLSCAQFMRVIKLYQATEHLIYGSETVNSIAIRLGFSDDVSFRRTFKNVLSYTPNEYRQAFKR